MNTEMSNGAKHWLKLSTCLEGKPIILKYQQKKGWSQSSDKYCCDRKPLQFSGWIEIIEVNNLKVMNSRDVYVSFSLSFSTGQKDWNLQSCWWKWKDQRRAGEKENYSVSNLPWDEGTHSDEPHSHLSLFCCSVQLQWQYYICHPLTLGVYKCTISPCWQHWSSIWNSPNL